MSADEDLRRRRRDFIRAHHPDRGGDPGQFIAGLARLEREPESSEPESSPVRVVIRVDLTWRMRLTGARRRLLRHDRTPRRVR